MSLTPPPGHPLPHAAAAVPDLRIVRSISDGCQPAEPFLSRPELLVGAALHTKALYFRTYPNDWS